MSSLVGGPSMVGGLGTGALCPPPLNPALQWVLYGRVQWCRGVVVTVRLCAAVLRLRPVHVARLPTSSALRQR